MVRDVSLSFNKEMNRERFIVAVDTQASLKKKASVSRSWILIDPNGQSRILDLDKYAIMQRVPINARDIRILEPMLSYPSTILGREKAIVLNLEVKISTLLLHFLFFFFNKKKIFFFFEYWAFQHIKAIITTEEVCNFTV